MKTMKKAMYILLVSLLSVTAYAQTEKRNLEFEDYSTQQEKVISQVFENKDYGQLVILLLDWEQKYNILSQEQKTLYASIAGGAIYYNLACAYSMTKKKDKAIDYFKKAVEAGFDEKGHIEEDTDLDNIRKDKRFIKILAEIPEKETYLDILRKAGNYVSADTTGLPGFNYESVSNWRIQSVKKYLKLDSIAGQGDEIAQILNLMTWVHNTIKHDGNHKPDCSEHDAMDLYNYYKTTGNGVNCRMLAIILNECYLSMGFKSRFVTCLPLDENDQDCHVINCVYSKTLKKWIWVDPTFNAYLKDENGMLLSIEEVRSRLIEGKTIILNEDANWNNKNKQTKKNYIDNYMAKNLYRIQCPTNSYFNVESPYRNANITYISLAPEEFEGYGQFEGFNKSGRSNGEIITHDPAYFWQIPVEN
ncbi:MAG: transglutaminase domain-containing protein [Dysgonamonadaceae bacterium]|jgi:hypothetical protein|nr:transglutaminase domain-containing protein [Dysgonamonadaceae bacterium]